MNSKHLLLVCWLAPLLMCLGCRTFEKEYAAAAGTNANNDPVAGAWEGRWVSDKSGHRGRLQAVIHPAGETHYQARFKATFWKIFSASYDVRLDVTQTNASGTQLTGSADLGWFAGGDYEYEATADGNAFNATYNSKADHGRFEMKRDHGAE